MRQKMQLGIIILLRMIIIGSIVSSMLRCNHDEIHDMKMNRTILTVALGFALSTASAFAAENVNVYSSRGEALIKPLMDSFTEQTGIKVNLVTGKTKALMQRLGAEGRNSPADILLTTDAGNLSAAESAGFFQPIESDVLEERIPANLRDAENHWFGLSQRARVLIVNPSVVKDGELSSYEDLTKDEWADRICVRSSSNIYNQSLLASFISHDGEKAAETWAAAVRGNMARKPQGNDRAQIAAVASGECDVAIVNSYYLGVMLNGDDEKQLAAAQKVELLYPNQDGRGTHVNISGAGVTKHAPNKANAIALIEFLAGDEAQQWYAEKNNEYPAAAGVELSHTVASWGEFKADALPVSKLGDLNAAAVRAFDRAGWE